VGLHEADLKAELTLRNAKLGVNGSSLEKKKKKTSFS
jgi:hypothetical protein